MMAFFAAGFGVSGPVGYPPENFFPANLPTNRHWFTVMDEFQGGLPSPSSLAIAALFLVSGVTGLPDTSSVQP